MKQRFGEALTLDDYFSGDPASRGIYDALARAIEAIGQVSVRITKSQVAFRRKRAFAWAWIPGKYLTGDRPPLVLSIVLPDHGGSARWKEVVELRAGWYMHHLELAEESDIDEEVLAWLRTAWEMAGAS
jgi:hypothetical protein